VKLFAKVFLCTLAILTTALAASGYSLISASFNESLARETDRALEEYQLLKFSLQSAMLGVEEAGSLSDETLAALAQQTVELAPKGTLVEIYKGDPKIRIASSIMVPRSAENIDGILPNELHYGLQRMADDGSQYMTVLGVFTQGNQQITLYTARNVDSIFLQRDELVKSYQVIYGIVILASAAVMLVLLAIVTRPIKKLTVVASQIAAGHYAERTQITTSDEIGMLGENFNQMAATIEDKIHELERTAQQKEDFVANFAHELKTPLTSVIGYADMIYQKDLSRQQVRDAAAYIMNEGMHLEALSFKLLELIVLNKEDFMLEELRADELLKDIGESLAPLMDKSHVKLEITAQAAYVHVEYDLIKTLLQNLIDNAVKAESTRIRLAGERNGRRYIVTVTDNGRGIPESELARITEAFYMVDKSRSRKQHGAGLGLAIASRIAQIHGTRLVFQSKTGEGTKVRFSLDAGGAA
jgi:signal transduction histidine kinase